MEAEAKERSDETNIKQEKAKEDKTGQNKPTQDKTKQDDSQDKVKTQPVFILMKWCALLIAEPTLAISYTTGSSATV